MTLNTFTALIFVAGVLTGIGVAILTVLGRQFPQAVRDFREGLRRRARTGNGGKDGAVRKHVLGERSRLWKVLGSRGK